MVCELPVDTLLLPQSELHGCMVFDLRPVLLLLAVAPQLVKDLLLHQSLRRFQSRQINAP